MTYRRIAPFLLFLALAVAACGGDSDSGGSAVHLDEPIGAPQEGTGSQQGTHYGDTTDNSDTTSPPISVIKDANVDIDVVRTHLNSAAQDVIDLTTSPRIGGFLVSSIVDEEQDMGKIEVKVPATNFEPFVGDLGGIGHTTRQELDGQDMTPEFFATRAKLQLVQQRIASLLSRLDATEDSGERYSLHRQLAAARGRARHLQGTKTYIEGETTFSTVDVALTGTPPAPAPPKPALERALATAKSISLAVVSGILLAAGVVLPLGVLAFFLYLAGAPIVRRMRANVARKEADFAA